MSNITEWSRLVEELERAAAAGHEVRAATLDRLIDCVCAEPWPDHESRAAAQALVCRLATVPRAATPPGPVERGG